MLVRDIEFASTSQDTLLPFHGRCHIAYVPSDGTVIGLSKLARLTKLMAKRLMTQEQLGLDITLALQQHMCCQGVAVVIAATHLALAGPAPPAEQVTVSVNGCFAEDHSTQLQVRGVDQGAVARNMCTHTHTHMLPTLLVLPSKPAGNISAHTHTHAHAHTYTHNTHMHTHAHTITSSRLSCLQCCTKSIMCERV